MAEGRGGKLAQFINIAMGPHAETEYLLNFSKRLDYVKTDISAVEALVAEG